LQRNTICKISAKKREAQFFFALSIAAKKYIIGVDENAGTGTI
jgi:hypothetical protein